MPRMSIGKHVNRWLLFTSLLMIFFGAVVASKFDCWGAIVCGTLIAVIGCFLNQHSISWVREEKD